MQNIVKIYALVAIVLLGLLACKAKPVKEQPVKMATRLANFSPLTSATDYVINTAIVADSILQLNITYPTPCTEHSFDLVADGKIAKSMPPQIAVNLVHKVASPANCNKKKKTTEVLLFNINPLRVNGQGKVLLILNDGKQVEFNYFPFISID